MSEYLLRFRRAAGLVHVELTPELKRQMKVFITASLGIGLLAVFVLRLLDATFEPFTWTVLVLTGAAYGWFGHSHLTMAPPISDNTMVGPLYDGDVDADFYGDEED